ncbi:homocitrate synthase [alpha proteobacterium BAL199]|nr:homocitrate synthase [alpha proteobacterium BAL199]
MPLSDVVIVDSTLREGEQFVHADFSRDAKLEIARALTSFGVNYLEVTSPAASRRSRTDAATIANAGLPAMVAAHIRCHKDDAAIAIDTGVGALHMVMATSPILRAASHGKAIAEVVRIAAEVGEFVRNRAPNIELRFSSEDAFRCPLNDLMNVYLPLSELRLFDRFGLADTTGAATPDRVAEVVNLLRRLTTTPIEFHGHNDIGCAIANAHAAAMNGATHINTTVLGLGERNGITPLEGLIAVMYAADRGRTMAQFQLSELPALCRRVAELAGVAVPFNQVLVGESAFSHKAGMHTKAVHNDPRSYEAMDPSDFGLTREIAISHRLTGWNAVRVRADALGLRLALADLKEATSRVKSAADEHTLSLDDVDRILTDVAALATARPH